MFARLFVFRGEEGATEISEMLYFSIQQFLLTFKKPRQAGYAHKLFLCPAHKLFVKTYLVAGKLFITFGTVCHF